MVNLKKYNGVLKLFVIFLTFFLILSCASTPYSVTKIEGKRLPITDKYTSTPSIEQYIAPYREKIAADKAAKHANTGASINTETPR